MKRRVQRFWGCDCCMDCGWMHYVFVIGLVGVEHTFISTAEFLLLLAIEVGDESGHARDAARWSDVLACIDVDLQSRLLMSWLEGHYCHVCIRTRDDKVPSWSEYRWNYTTVPQRSGRSCGTVRTNWHGNRKWPWKGNKAFHDPASQNLFRCHSIYVSWKHEQEISSRDLCKFLNNLTIERALPRENMT